MIQVRYNYGSLQSDSRKTCSQRQDDNIMTKWEDRMYKLVRYKPRDRRTPGEVLSWIGSCLPFRESCFLLAPALLHLSRQTSPSLASVLLYFFPPPLRAFSHSHHHGMSTGGSLAECVSHIIGAQGCVHWRYANAASAWKLSVQVDVVVTSAWKKSLKNNTMYRINIKTALLTY